MTDTETIKPALSPDESVLALLSERTKTRLRDAVVELRRLREKVRREREAAERAYAALDDLVEMIEASFLPPEANARFVGGQVQTNDSAILPPEDKP